MLLVSIYYCKMGNIKIEHDEHFIYTAYFSDDTSHQNNNSKLSNHIKAELDAYFSNPLHRFNLPLKPQGSPFQQRVWNALLDIALGMPLTYGELSKKLNSSPRAIGQACKRNPITVFIPCHRVVSKTGLGGYMGKSNAIHYKQQLLGHEAAKN